MKALSIGRDLNCDIVINDSTDVISRRHAVLTISSSGKITIMDQSRNGTYVNGIRISPNVPVPVSKKDIISFAHIAKLDWNAIPATTNKSMRNILIGVITVMVAICAWLGYTYYTSDSNSGNMGGQPTTIEVKNDSTDMKKEESVQKDSTDKAKEKELEKKKSESINPDKPNKKRGEKERGQNKDKNKNKNQNKSETDSTKNDRPIG